MYLMKYVVVEISASFAFFSYVTAALRNLSPRWLALITVPSVWKMEPTTTGSLNVEGK